MNTSEIFEKLRSSGVASQTKALHTTCMYFHLWKEGSTFDLSKKSVQTHRARLRKIGIDIAIPYAGESDSADCP